MHSTHVIIMIAIVYTLVNTMFIAIFMYAEYQSSVQFSRHRQIRMYGCTFNYHYYLISKINQFFFLFLSLPSFLPLLSLLHTHNPCKRAMRRVCAYYMSRHKRLQHMRSLSLPHVGPSAFTADCRSESYLREVTPSNIHTLNITKEVEYSSQILNITQLLLIHGHPRNFLCACIHARIHKTY